MLIAMSLDDTILELARQVPALIVLVYLVITFQKSVAKKDESLATLGDTCHAFQQRLASEHHDLAESLRATLDANSKMLGDVSATIRQAIETQKQLAEQLRKTS